MPPEPPAHDGAGDSFAAIADGYGSVAITGDIDVATAPELQRVLFEALDVLAGPRLRVDFSHVTFIDSTGLAALVAARNNALSRGKTGADRAGIQPRNPPPAHHRFGRHFSQRK